MNSNEVVKVRIYSHPTWDTKLILEASAYDHDQALQNIPDDEDASLLTFTESTMTRQALYELPEFDG